MKVVVREKKKLHPSLPLFGLLAVEEGVIDAALAVVLGRRPFCGAFSGLLPLLFFAPLSLTTLHREKTNAPKRLR